VDEAADRQARFQPFQEAVLWLVGRGSAHGAILEINAVTLPGEKAATG
jgi:hypothetical protein